MASARPHLAGAIVDGMPQHRTVIPDGEANLSVAALDQLLSGGAWRREANTITRTFTLKGFKSAIAFVNRIAEAANEANHHPDIHIEGYRKVRIVLTTHATGGLSDADVNLARRIDELVRDPA